VATRSAAMGAEVFQGQSNRPVAPVRRSPVFVICSGPQKARQPK